MTVGDRPIRVTHVITDLDVGGAEMVLVRLLEEQDRRRFLPSVITLGTDEPLGADLRRSGVPVRTAGMSPASAPAAFLRLRRLLAESRPDVVQTWMYHADLLGGIAARTIGVRAISWGVHQTDLPVGGIRRSTRLIAGLNARLSPRLPAWIVCCSAASERVHVADGYPRDRTSVIRNGFRLAPLDPRAGEVVRAELGLRPGAPIVGRVGRFHPQKDHRTFLRAAALVAERHPDVTFLLAGAGLDDTNAALDAWISETGLEDRVRLLGPRADVARLHEAMDVAVSSSAFGEALPMVIGEAMERATPVVTTDVGDSAELVGGTGVVVPPRDPRALAEGVSRLLSESPGERRRRGELARDRISERFSLSRMVEEYERVHHRLAQASA